MFCIKCGYRLSEGARFCPQCGAAVEKPQTKSAADGVLGDAADNVPRMAPDVTAPMPRIASVAEATRPATVSAPLGAMPTSGEVQTPRKSKAPLVAAGIIAAIVLVGGVTIFAFGLGGNGNSSNTAAVQAVDSGSAEGSGSADSNIDTLLPEEDQPVEGGANQSEADPEAGVADAPLTQVHTYRNARFGFSASIPDRFEVSLVPANNDGLGYSDPNSNVSITVSGIRNMGLSAQQQLDALDLSGKQDVYTASEDGWYVASWRDGNTIVYERTLVQDEKCCTMRFEYPVSQKDEGSSLVESLAESLTFFNDSVL